MIRKSKTILMARKRNAGRSQILLRQLGVVGIRGMRSFIHLHQVTTTLSFSPNLDSTSHIIHMASHRGRHCFRRVTDYFTHREQMIILQQILLQTKKNTTFLQAIYNRQNVDEDTSEMVEEFQLPVDSMESFRRMEDPLQDRPKAKALVSYNVDDYTSTTLLIYVYET